VNLNMVIQLLKVNMVRLDDVLKSPIDHQIIQSEKTEAKLALQFPYVKLKGQIEVRHLTFGFNPLADPIIEDINFSLPPGKMVALVGPTGCGKSTIAKLIAGLLEPWKGELLFDHTLRSQIPRKVITNSLSVVEQESHLFSGTVKENIAFFNPLVNQQDIIKAAKDACIHDDILLRKGGYDLQLEHDGINLSGGQKQRLEIAHALVNNPSILILDEATSALDSKTELEIMQNIRKRGCTSLIIAHRLQSIRHCDEIFVIDKGRIIQKGSHSELIEIPGLYKTLTELEQDSSTFITL
jgi:ATP-binding cassette, subfamily C, bacterial